MLDFVSVVYDLFHYDLIRDAAHAQKIMYEMNGFSGVAAVGMFPVMQELEQLQTNGRERLVYEQFQRLRGIQAFIDRNNPAR